MNVHGIVCNIIECAPQPAKLNHTHALTPNPQVLQCCVSVGVCVGLRERGWVVYKWGCALVVGLGL